MQLSLPFGSKHLSLELKSAKVLRVLTPKKLQSSLTEDALVLKALRHPISSKILPETVKAGQKVILVVPDKTRYCGASLFLPLLLAELNQAGVPDSDIEILLAAGSHAKHEQGEIKNLLGEDVCKRIAVTEHDSKKVEDLVFVGSTKFGTPVSINRKILDSDIVIVCGTVVHHYFAGYGGGPKMINPGCAGYETIRRNHALSVDYQTGRLHPACRAGNIDANPVQEDLRDSMRFVSVDFSFATILNASGRIVEALSGDLFAAHAKACDMIDTYYKVSIGEPADLVIVSCGGFPKDINFIQAHKAIENAFQAVKRDGVILAIAECSQGIGSETFLEWFDVEGEEAFNQALIRKFTLNATTAVSLRTKTHEVKIVLVSHLPQKLVTRLGLYHAESLEEGFVYAKKILPRNFTSYVIPNGSLTLPVLQK